MDSKAGMLSTLMLTQVISHPLIHTCSSQVEEHALKMIPAQQVAYELL